MSVVRIIFFRLLLLLLSSPLPLPFLTITKVIVECSSECIYTRNGKNDNDQPTNNCYVNKWKFHRKWIDIVMNAATQHNSFTSIPRTAANIHTTTNGTNKNLNKTEQRTKPSKKKRTQMNEKKTNNREIVVWW